VICEDGPVTDASGEFRRRTIALIVNPVAGRGRARRVSRTIAGVLGEYSGVRVIDAGRSAAGSLAAVQSAATAGVDAVVVCGGDGIVHLAANVLAGGPIPLGVLPAGSGNDIADLLGMVPDPIRAAHQIGAAVVANRVRRIDIGRCDGPPLVAGTVRAFVGLVYAGFDSAVNERANRLRMVPARTRYNIALAIETMRLRARRMRIGLDGEIRDVTATLVAVGNGAQYGGGKRIAPHAVWHDGVFEVAVVARVSRRTLARLAPTLPRAGHVGHPAVSFHEAATVSLEAPDRPDTIAYADGEIVGPLPLKVWVEAAALPMVVPVS
jgi:diacylglycerol kinase (ATP)